MSSSAQNLIVGKWEVENAPTKMTAEFNRDGTAQITVLGETIRAKYQLNDDELVWSVNGISSKSKVSVTANELELTDDQNRTIKYQRR